VDRATATPRGEAAGVERMARLFGSTPEALRAERAGARLGWGDVFIAHRIAARGGHPLEKVFAARRSGAAWGEIADEARVDVETLVRDVSAVWPEAVRAAAPPGAPPSTPAAPAEGGRGIGDKVRDLLGGKPSEGARDEAPAERPQDEIRDRMIRGGGRGR
jgi:hypothetical protein